jgi:predicted aldo/keto reductase-like oxidoreductase
MEAMRQAKAGGAVRFIGFTGHNPWLMMTSLKAADGELDTVQIPFNVMRREYGEDPALGLFEYCQKRDIGVIIMKPVAAGRITRNLSTALKFIFAHEMATAIPGAASVAEFAADVQAAEEFERLSPADQQRFRTDEGVLGEDCCRGCGYCLPCPSGMDIPALLRAERCGSLFGLKEWIREDCDRLKVDMSQCAECGECEKRCPFDIPVRSRLDGAKALLAKRAG